MSKHTPGPWRIVETLQENMISSWAIEVGTRPLGFFPYVYKFADEAKTCGGYASDPVWHANARLIASAPDMIDVLKEIKRKLRIDDPIDMYDSVCAAIAKATGETE